MHGGSGPVGPASPAWRTGRYSKALPGRLAETYRQSLNDGDLLILRDDIALLDSRIGELLQRVDTGETGVRWRAARAALGRLQTATAAGDQGAMDKALADLETAIMAGEGDSAAWEEIGEALDRRERLVRSERRRLVQLQQMITAEQATAMMAAVATVIREHVRDRVALGAISAALAELAQRPGGFDQS